MALNGDRNWCWGSLRPWQILHSRLAEKGTRGQGLDVCELIDETLGATDLRNGAEEGARYYYEAYFLDDDGEFWRHGGVMEARIREWLARREAEEEEEEVYAAEEEEEEEQERDPIVLSKCCAGRSAISTRAWAPSPGEEEDDYCGHYEEDEEEEDSTIAGVSKYVARQQPSIIATSKPSYEVADLCPVCLEKLLPNEPLFLLPCRHKFHAVCLSPWLLQSPHACCPCCRAPVPANLTPQQPTLAAPSSDPTPSSSDYPDAPPGDADIMRLLADMEAALERFGFRS